MKFDYGTCTVKDLRATTTQKPNSDKVVVSGITIDGRECEPTQRFWTSLQAKFGFSTNIFRYFSHAEVFDRISQVRPKDGLRFCIEDGEEPGKKGKLLAVTSPEKAVIKHDALLGLLKDKGVDVDSLSYDGKRMSRSRIGMGSGEMFTSTGPNSNPDRLHGDSTVSADGTPLGRTPDEQLSKVPAVTYHDGIISSLHTPPTTRDSQICGDWFSNRFTIGTPIDGFGRPSVHLVLLRTICSNLAIGYSSAFRSELSLGKGEDTFDYALQRAIEGFDNEEGYLALQQRFEAAGRSWASIAEINRLYKTLVRLHHKNEVLVRAKHQGAKAMIKGDDGASLADYSPLMVSYRKLVGDLTQTYGLANLDALSNKKQRTLPSGVKVYDVLNFATEAATHHVKPAGALQLQAFLGDTVSTEYDLEDTADKMQDWQALLIDNQVAAAL